MSQSQRKGRFTITRATTDDKIDLTISTQYSNPTPTYQNLLKDGHSPSKDSKLKSALDDHRILKSSNELPLFNLPEVQSSPLLKFTPVQSDHINPDSILDKSREEENTSEVQFMEIVESHVCKMFTDMLHIHRELMVEILDKEDKNKDRLDVMFKKIEELSRQNAMLNLENQMLSKKLGL